MNFRACVRGLKVFRSLVSHLYKGNSWGRRAHALTGQSNDAQILRRPGNPSPEIRERQLFNGLADQLANAKKHSYYFAGTGRDPCARSDQSGRIGRYRSRKSDLAGTAEGGPPFGAMTSVPLSQLARVFASPGPIYDPQGDNRFRGSSRALRRWFPPRRAGTQHVFLPLHPGRLHVGPGRTGAGPPGVPGRRDKPSSRSPLSWTSSRCAIRVHPPFSRSFSKKPTR